MRTRFAPSPTGFLHVGGLRTALYSYLLAKKSGGQFIVRIEDTDRARGVEGAVENILRTLHWAGLDPDEGVMLQNGAVTERGDAGPYVQSERLDLYREHAQTLLASGHAYYAFDTPEEIDAMRKELQKAGHPSPKYDASVRLRMKNSLSLPPEETRKRLDTDEPHVVRLLVDPAQSVTFRDEIRGDLSFAGKTIDDQVLLKSDGFPTYHLAHVVDDHLMKIDMVVRGEEWLSSLPKHLLLFRAFGWEPPQYAHVPLLLNRDRSKLSKRQDAVATEEYIEKGYLPAALINFLALLGWNPGTEQELFSLSELTEAFSLARVQKAGAIFDTEKLDWLQGQWIRKMPRDEFADHLRPLVVARFPSALHDEEFVRKVALIQERITFLSDAPDMLSYFYEEPEVTLELLAEKKQKVTPETVPDILRALLSSLHDVAEDEWREDILKERLFALGEEKGWKRGQVLWPLRAALTGKPFSPGAFEVAAALGRSTTIARLERALEAVI